MNDLALAFWVGITQGLLHALGPDHCAAVATLGTAPGRRHAAFWTAVRFATGHALTLGLLSTLSLTAGLVLSERFERSAELMGGGLLVAIALSALLVPGALHHGHPHLPGHARDHRHARVSAAAGVLLAVSGVRALIVALVPLLVAGGLRSHAFAYIPGFALGVFFGMGAMGALLSAGMDRLNEVATRRAHRLAAVSSGVLGIFWMAKHV